MRSLRLLVPILFCAARLAAQVDTPAPGTDEKALSFGLNTSHGNRNSLSLSAAFDWRENLGNFENDLDANVSLSDSLGEGDGVSDEQAVDWTIRTAIGAAARRRWFILGHLSGERHEYAGLDFRGIWGVGAGRHVVETDLVRLTLEAGIGLAREHPEGEPAARFRMPFVHGMLSWRLGEKTKLAQRLQIEANAEDSGDVRLSSDTEISIRITEHLSLRPSVKVNWDDRPIGDAEALDLSTHTSLSFEF